MPGAVIKIVDDNGQPLGRNQEGEVWLKGPMIMKGYHNLPSETAAALTADGFFKTGDLGKVDDDGFLYITGRKKDLIITGGEKAVPREIEETLNRHPAVAESAVVGKKDASRGEVVVAFVTLKPGQTATGDQIRSFARDENLATFKVPREVFIIDELPARLPARCLSASWWKRSTRRQRRRPFTFVTTTLKSGDGPCRLPSAFGRFFIDLGIFAVGVHLFMFVDVYVNITTPLNNFGIISLLGGAFFLISYGLFEVIMAATPGKRIAGLAIAHDDGMPATRGSLFKRWAVKQIAVFFACPMVVLWTMLTPYNNWIRVPDFVDSGNS